MHVLFWFKGIIHFNRNPNLWFLCKYVELELFLLCSVITLLMYLNFLCLKLSTTHFLYRRPMKVSQVRTRLRSCCRPSEMHQLQRRCVHWHFWRSIYSSFRRSQNVLYFSLQCCLKDFSESTTLMAFLMMYLIHHRSISWCCVKWCPDCLSNFRFCHTHVMVLKLGSSVKLSQTWSLWHLFFFCSSRWIFLVLLFLEVWESKVPLWYID